MAAAATAPHARLSFNFAGAPALNGKEFLAWRAAHPVGTSAGIALDVQLPLGRYDEDKLINLGQNRYVFRPQLGVLHTRGPWSFELTGSAYYFGKNDESSGARSASKNSEAMVKVLVPSAKGCANPSKT